MVAKSQVKSIHAMTAIAATAVSVVERIDAGGSTELLLGILRKAVEEHAASAFGPALLQPKTRAVA